ncbi:efflux RND transporter periplasmic adaptor subunit [Sulfurimonas sp. HSL3-2]|uniref:efflux RND transporter periplasmic adaptor subunit n=1 Tax=Hydrocurvibacter mobilis TaxID=3131936 RepID=UPI0031F879FB
MQEMKKVTSYKSSGFLWKSLLLSFILVIAFISYKIFMPKEDQNAYTYVSEPLKKGNLVITVSATGNIQPIEQVEVGSEVSGTIEKVFVDYNDVVKKGQILAELDKTKYKSALNKAEASLSAAKSSLENMQAQLYQADSVITRDKMLKESTKGALPSRNDWDKDWSNYMIAKAQVSNAEAQVEQAKQALISAEYDLQKTTIYSPIDGIILVRNIDPGQTVAASFQTPVLFNIAKDLTKMELQASIDEADIAKVKAGQDAKFTVDAYADKTFKAKVRLVRVNSEIVEGVVTYKAIMNVDNSDLLLKPGMSADIDITTQTIDNEFIVPRAALLFIPVKPKTKTFFGSRTAPKANIDPKPHLWILQNGEPKKVYVKLLGNSGSYSAIASDSLKEGDPIIITQEKAK